MFRGRLCDWRIRSIRAVGCACVVTAVVAGEAKEAPLKESLSSWEPSITAKFAAGFKDNVTLAVNREQESPFVKTAIDAVAVRLPVDGTQIMLLLLGEDTRYFSADSVDHEDLLFGQAEIRKFWLNDWQGALSFDLGGSAVGSPGAFGELVAGAGIAVHPPDVRWHDGRLLGGRPADNHRADVRKRLRGDRRL
jgi:hypothetical protein